MPGTKRGPRSYSQCFPDILLRVALTKKQGIIGDSEAARVEEATGSSVSSYPSDEIWGESELPPDIFSYTHLLSSLEKLGRHRACLSALQEMRARGIKVRCARRGREQRAGIRQSRPRQLPPRWVYTEMIIESECVIRTARLLVMVGVGASKKIPGIFYRYEDTVER